jgi:gentisate 1,2-dioxygenase
MAGTPETIVDELPELYHELERLHMVPLWEIAPRLLPREPQPLVIPYLWRWSEIAPLAHRSAKLVPIERGGERRVIAFMNPGLGGKWAATNTLWAGVQILLPGETAPAHRHSPAAIHLNGERFSWRTGDFFVIPPWAWHEHANDTHADAILFSVQDTPIL